jgi:hypothetical protein
MQDWLSILQKIN